MMSTKERIVWLAVTGGSALVMAGIIIWSLVTS